MDSTVKPLKTTNSATATPTSACAWTSASASASTSASASKTTTNSSTRDEPSKNWANLPSDIIVNLLRYLDLKIDIPRLRGVCPAWRSALPLSIIPKVPSSFEIPGFYNNRPLLLLQTRFYFLSPLNPTLGGQWIARMGEVGYNKWHIFNPLNVHDYFFSFPPVTGEINLLSCRIQELCSSWCVVGGSRSGSDLNSDGAKLESEAKKVVGGWNFKSDYLFAVLAQLETPGRGDEGGLVLWRLGDKKNTRFEETFAHTWRILDIAYLNGKFYAFDLASWRMGVIDVDDYGSDEIPKMEFFAVPNILGEHINDQFSVAIDGCKFMLGTVFLVPSNGRLFMVIVANPVVELDVDEVKDEDGEAAEKKLIMFYFVLKEGQEMEHNTWERMPDIGDNIFFIGYDSSFSLPSSSKNLPRWKPGSICLFTWPFPMIFDYGKPKGLQNVTFAGYWRYLKMYQHNTEEEEEKGIVRFEKLGKHKYTKVFFPPPAWVIWRCPSRGNAVVILHNLKFSEKW